MRGILFFTLFVSSLPFVFKSPFNGALLWYVFSLGNFHTLVWGFFSDLHYAYIIAIVTCLSWVISSPGSAFTIPASTHLGVPKPGVGTGGSAKVDLGAPGYVKSHT